MPLFAECWLSSLPLRFNDLGCGSIPAVAVVVALLVGAELVVCAGRRRRCGGEWSWAGAGSRRLGLGEVSWGGCGGLRPKVEVRGC